MEPGHYSESPGSVANEALAEPGHSGNESDGAVAAANNAGDDSDEYIDFYDYDAPDTEHVPSRLSTIDFD